MKSKVSFFLLLTCFLCVALAWTGDEPEPLIPPSLPNVVQDTVAFGPGIQPIESPELPSVTRSELPRPEWIYLTTPDLPSVTRLDLPRPEWVSLVEPQLPATDPTRTITYNGVDLSGGVNSAFAVKARNQCDDSQNFLPDSIGGFYAREGYARLTSQNCVRVYGLAAIGDDVFLRSATGYTHIYQNGSLSDSGGNQTANTVGYYVAAGELGVLLCAPGSEPKYYDGSFNTFGNYVWEDTIQWPNWIDHDPTGPGMITFHDSTRTMEPDRWRGFWIEFTNGELEDSIKQIVSNGDHWFRVDGIAHEQTANSYAILAGLDSTGVMPKGNNCVVYKECLFGWHTTNPKRIYYSYPPNEDVTDQDYCAFHPDAYVVAQDEPNYLLVAGGGIWVFEDDRVEKITGSGTSYSINALIDNIGCPFPYTIAQHGNDIYWLANNGVWTTAASATYYAEGTSGLLKISGPIDHKLKDLRRRASIAGAGFDGTGKYWLSISTDSDTTPDETFVYDTKTNGWWPQTCGFSYLAFSDYPGDTSGFICAFKDSGYIYNWGAATDAGGQIEYFWKREFDENPVNDKLARVGWLYGTFTDSVLLKVYEGSSSTCAESLIWTDTGVIEKMDYFQSAQDNRLTLELFTRDKGAVIRQLGFEYEDLGRRPK